MRMFGGLFLITHTYTMAKKKTYKKKSGVKGIFDFLKCIFQEKTPWESLTEADHKSFSPFMINRFISMHPDYTDAINFCQKLTITGMKPREVYKVYLDLFPKSKFYAKYIKSSKSLHRPITYPNNSLIDFVAKQENWSTTQTKENLEMLHDIDVNEYASMIGTYLSRFGLSESEEKLLNPLK